MAIQEHCGGASGNAELGHDVALLSAAVPCFHLAIGVGAG